MKSPKIKDLNGYNGRQYTITISEEHIRRMKWKKGTEVYIAKNPEHDSLYVEEMK